MNHIEIIHNPFTVDTNFIVNGLVPAENCTLWKHKEERLQRWIEGLFAELRELFNNDPQVGVCFRGVESDWLDVSEAAEQARAGGMTVTIAWEEVESAEARLNKVRTLVDRAKQHEVFGDYLKNNSETIKFLEEALDRDFDVHVVATMSSGKSTLINAMLGRDLLPARNEATTATIASITDCDHMSPHFDAQLLGSDGLPIASAKDVTLEKIDEWNKQDSSSRIEIVGDIVGVKEREYVRLVLTDTPGPNNSQDPSHQKTTLGFIQDVRRNPLILYLLNATQLGTNDDKNLLGLVAQTMSRGGKQSKDRFIFVVNKVDQFDPENGENLPDVLGRVRTYLQEQGIPNPQIYPVSAALARLIRKPAEAHTRYERGEYGKISGLFSEEKSMDLPQYMPLTSRVRRKLGGRQLSSLLVSSGVPALECMIDEYIDKYNLPNRVMRTNQALQQAIARALNEAELDTQLALDEQALAPLREEVAALQRKQQQGLDLIAKEATLESESKDLPPEVEQVLFNIEVEIDEFIRAIRSKFDRDSESVHKANALTDEIEKQIRFEHATLENKYNEVIASRRDATAAMLKREYQHFVLALFEDSHTMQLPEMDVLRRAVEDIDFTLREADLHQKNVLLRTEKKSTSTWYKPWTWGDTKDLEIWGTETRVDLRKFWNKKEVLLQTQLEEGVEVARNQIEKASEELIESYRAYMAREFDGRFRALVDNLNKKLIDKNFREEAVAQGKELKAWIIDYKGELAATLAV